jgi:predicted small integral membrane protein
LVAILSGLRLAASRHWPLVILAGAAFLIPVVLKVFEMAGREEKPRRWVLSLETIRFLILFLVSLLVMRVPFSGQGALGGKRT